MMKIKTAFLFVAVCFVSDSAMALSCGNEDGFEEILFTGRVLNVLPAEGQLTPEKTEKRFEKVERARFQKTSVIDVRVENVLKGSVYKDSVVRVVIPPAWDVTSEGKKIDVKTGAIFIGGRRFDDENIWWSSCYQMLQGRSVLDIDWDGEVSSQWVGYREYLNIWKVARRYDDLVDGRSPSAVSPEGSASIDALLSEIGDFDRLLDFHRKRYFVDKNLANGGDYAFALLKAGDAAAATELLRVLKGIYGTTPTITSVENTIKLTEGEPANVPLRNLSALSFSKGMIVDDVNFSGERISNVRASSISANSAEFSNSVLSNIKVESGVLADADFSRVHFVDVDFSNPYPNRAPGTYHFVARRASLQQAVAERLTLDGDFSEANFQDVSAKVMKLGGSFQKAVFDNASIENLSIRNADFRGASMRGVRLKNSHMSSVDLRGVDFTGALLEGTLDWIAINYDETTIWPRGELPEPLKPRPPLALTFP
jgi:uncharacterized protein YjbI with pentapeptide repeats